METVQSGPESNDSLQFLLDGLDATIEGSSDLVVEGLEKQGDEIRNFINEENSSEVNV